jgi:hypothetical protein
MKTVLELIRKAGGWHPGLYLKIDNPPYMELVIEAMDESGGSTKAELGRTAEMALHHLGDEI